MVKCNWQGKRDETGTPMKEGGRVRGDRSMGVEDVELVNERMGQSLHEVCLTYCGYCDRYNSDGVGSRSAIREDRDLLSVLGRGLPLHELRCSHDTSEQIPPTFSRLQERSPAR